MTFNMKMIDEHIPKYITMYTEQIGEAPTSWWGALEWLSDGSAAGKFEAKEIERVEEMLKVG